MLILALASSSWVLTVTIWHHISPDTRIKGRFRSPMTVTRGIQFIKTGWPTRFFPIVLVMQSSLMRRREYASHSAGDLRDATGEPRDYAVENLRTGCQWAPGISIRVVFV